MKINDVIDLIDNKKSKITDKDFPAQTFEMPDELYKWIQVYSPQTVLVWNLFNELIFCTDSVERHVGYKADELMGMKWTNAFPDGIVRDFKKTTLRLAPGESLKTMVELPNKQGQMKWYCWTVSKQVADEKVYYISLLQLLHDKEQIEELYIENEKLAVASQLAASVVHEIRNPLTSLKGFVQLMESGMEAKEEYFRIMNEEIEKMEAMTSELLYISKPPTNEKSWESVHSMIKDVVMLLEPQARKKNAILDCMRQHDKEVYCNRSQIKQVLLNLVKNAIEAIDHDHGIITIETKILLKYVEIRVSDNGPGVPGDLVKRLGEPFITTKKNGTGLGLMVTKQLMNQHGGELKVYSNEGRGSTFKATLPVVPHNKADLD